MSDDFSAPTRRRVLSVLGLSGVTGLAGCGQQDDTSSPTEPPECPGKRGKTSSSPEITDYTAAPTEQAGELVVSMRAEDDEGLRSIAAGVDEHMAEKSVDGAQSATLSHQKITTQEADTLTPFGQNTVTYRAEDTDGITTTAQYETYVRKYNKMEDTRLDIGAVYIPQAGDGLTRCLDDEADTEPAVGLYAEDPIPNEINTKHIDQMTGHGINRILYDYSGRPKHGGRLLEFLEAELINQVEIEPVYTKMPFLRNMDKSWKDTIMPRDLPFLREHVLKRENVSTYHGRPVVSTWSFSHFGRPDSEACDKLMKEFGSYESFVEEMRSHLRVEGTDPFFVVSKGSITDFDNEWGELISQFDAATTWFGGALTPRETVSWENAYEDVEQNFRATQRFTDNQDMEFIPVVFPGYNERDNTCYGKNKHLPRRTKQFRRMLELADEYRSTDRITIASWNDWIEGHQIEPGTFRGTNYGTDYVEIVKEFQTE